MNGIRSCRASPPEADAPPAQALPAALRGCSYVHMPDEPISEERANRLEVVPGKK